MPQTNSAQAVSQLVEAFQREMERLPRDGNQLAWDLTMADIVSNGVIFSSDMQYLFHKWYTVVQRNMTDVLFNMEQLDNILANGNVRLLDPEQTEKAARTLISLPDLLRDFKTKCIPPALVQVCASLIIEIELLRKHLMDYWTEQHKAEGAS
jgi:hypothetical protein